MGNSSELRVGIIGCGGIAGGKHLPSLSKINAVKLVAFCDIIEERAAEKACNYGVDGAAVYTDYQKMLQAEKLDVVHICTPNNSHSEITVAALEAGCHVMCEKPMAKTAEEAQKMVEAAKRTGKKLTIGYQNRFRTDSRYLKAFCEQGGLGEIYFAKAHALRRRAVPTWGVFLDAEAQGGGPLIDIGTHALDLTLWMMNNYEPEFAVGNTYRKLGDRENCANPWGPWDPKKFTVEDSAFGYIHFKNGATVFLESSWALNLRVSGEAICTLCGTEAGADMWDGLQINGERFSKLYVEKAQLEPGSVPFYSGDDEKDADVEAAMWIESILADKAPIVLPEQALVVTEILEAIYKSSETGKPVYF
ncbi:MAG: Gfo/Idh/MocA family oxidoreductase [Armatimonadetes bacterium]|jgi:predicted dehydrogenase|nr:Gfo/Idh/MocA family oxidoreductase [Armatimonadota bacterium]